MPPSSFGADLLVVEDQHLMRLALVHELQTAFPASVVHAAGSISTVIELAELIPFALVLIDPGLPGYDPHSARDRLHVIRSIVEQTPAAIHVVITGSDSLEEWEACQRLGVAGYIAKNNLRPGAMADIVQEIAEAGKSVGLDHDESTEPEVYHSALSPREQEVLVWMRQRPSGVSRKEIYDQLGSHLNIDAASAERYYKRAKAKLLKIGVLSNLF
ncbi:MULTISPECIES: response regulator transcription factor [unclassified Phyllobacterium]|uniref:response regulator transcription factor n=1 Tax=Phyllobacterium TaxID=28100 RepID=UPI0004895EC1|nr:MULTISPECIES: response regulator transcription factor [unclassified Phyllobacterium]UGY11046.1 response regulator transcription factor [Phyllobacterium sp. T1018]SFI53222.1 DNA-binding response regulator, NarL/FixJ family, contains REC and HTH domains [Phyllobacterium sp. CL33Tsu]